MRDSRVVYLFPISHIRIFSFSRVVKHVYHKYTYIFVLTWHEACFQSTCKYFSVTTHTHIFILTCSKTCFFLSFREMLNRDPGNCVTPLYKTYKNFLLDNLSNLANRL